MPAARFAHTRNRHSEDGIDILSNPSLQSISITINADLGLSSLSVLCYVLLI
jgi:hypothetical protein